MKTHARARRPETRRAARPFAWALEPHVATAVSTARCPMCRFPGFVTTAEGGRCRRCGLEMTN